MTRIPAVLVALLTAAAIGGCTIPKPPGAGTVRYRDPVFVNYGVTPDITYGSAVPQGATNPIALKLDLYRPLNDTQTSRPAIIWVHGGGFSGGDKGSGPSADLAQKFAKLGYVTASINYRLIANGCTGSNITPACFQAAVDAQHDAQAAVRFLRAHAADYGIDPTRIGIGGESAGAITSVAVGVHSEDVGTSGNPGYPSQVEGFSSISGGLPERALRRAPATRPGSSSTARPTRSSPTSGRSTRRRRLLSNHVPAFLELLDGAGHVPYAQYGELFYEQSDYFFYDLLDLAHAAGQPASVRARRERGWRRAWPGSTRPSRARCACASARRRRSGPRTPAPPAAPARRARS